jgi:hypothetical protein
LAAIALAAMALALPASVARAQSVPAPVGHVFIIVLENKDYDVTFGEDSPAPYLANKLASKGQLLTEYYGTGHFSLGNYITMISGQSENPETQADCQVFSEMTPGTIGADGQALGSGCVYPPEVDTIAGQLNDAGLRWRGYMEDMGDDPTRERTRCAHPEIGAQDKTQAATPTDQYATRHNPFVYFHSIIDDQALCDANVVPLRMLNTQLAREHRTREYTFITPDLCSDGHDEECPDPNQPGGYEGINEFLHEWVPAIRGSAAFKEDGLLVITFDESESGGDACCFVPSGPNTPMQGAFEGPGGGRTGAVLMSPFIKPGTVNHTPYNHYSLLRSTEDIFGLEHLGYAARDEVVPFGRDVFNRKPKR